MLERLLASNSRPTFEPASQWETVTIDMSGCKLEVTMPPHDHEFPEQRLLRVNLFDEKLYRYETEPDRNGYPPHYKGVTVPGILQRNWDSYGAFWKTRRIGGLQCAAVVCDTSKMAGELNCFNPEHLERLIIHGLYYSRGPGNGYKDHNVPVNWKIIEQDRVEWVCFESWAKTPAWDHSKNSNYDSNFVAWMCTPLFTDKYLLFTFSSIGSIPAAASNTLFFDRIQKVAPSIKIALSQESLKQKALAQRSFPNARFSQTREPETWKYYDSFRNGNILEGEKPIVFEGKCTPPPNLY